MKKADEFASPPSDYNVIVPDGWFQLLLDPDDRDRAIVALAERQFRGIDNAPRLKEQFMRELQRKAREAYRAGGMELYLSTLTIGPIPLASSLLISMLSPDAWPQNLDVEALAEHLLVLDAQKAEARERTGCLASELSVVEVVDLEAVGKAVRRRCREAPDPEHQLGNELPTTTLSYYVSIPATTSWLLMNFSTPMDPLADKMVELFDVVAGTLHWG
ncbi:hypothetical protein ACFVXC_32440 [Streptomyces sp. NPDC058257]|uniref:hypothetical protein n=1 Tax=Streptomyces sp. NPDC058257 TaxID=3346409 RepID=UPI0036E6FAF8